MWTPASPLARAPAFASNPAMSFVLTYQIALVAGCFLLGLLGAALLFRRGASRWAWNLADLVWVVVGGLGALAAILAGVYKNDSSQLNRQIDVAYAALQSFDTEAARFRLLYCETVSPRPDIAAATRDLCDKVEFLSASTAESHDLPLFHSVSRISRPLQGLGLLAGREDEAMMEEFEALETARFLAFASEDETTRRAAAVLSAAPEAAPVAVEFRLLARSYDDLILKLGRLRTEWDFLQANTQFLAVQVLAICMIAFAAPFRLGKSFAELR